MIMMVLSFRFNLVKDIELFENCFPNTTHSGKDSSSFPVKINGNLYNWQCMYSFVYMYV